MYEIRSQTRLLVLKVDIGLKAVKVVEVHADLKSLEVCKVDESVKKAFISYMHG